MIAIPQNVLDILRALNERGHEAYVVGGCVRDSLLGRTPTDWDVTTSALPEETAGIFDALGGYTVAKTGLAHGTLTIIKEHCPVEITTYRVDGAYSDARHPDAVRFTRSLREDLSRRDFTINAMAYHPDVGLVDYFSGRADLEARRICCVGDPDKRFGEDALRILRALRFASVLEFSLEKMTGESLHRQAFLLLQIAAERIAAEMNKLLCGPATFPVLMEYPDVFEVILPELSPMRDHPQYNAYHKYDIYEHTMRAVQAAPPLSVLRWVLLLHDSGKPSCFTRDAEGVGHFYGHPAVSAQITGEVLRRMKLDTATIERAVMLVTYHDVRLTAKEAEVKRWLRRLGEEAFFQLLEVQKADVRGQHPDLLYRIQDIEAIGQTAREVLASQACFSLKDLQVNGHDLIQIGIYPGKLLGDTLETLLEAVIDGRCPNRKEDLLEMAKAMR